MAGTDHLARPTGPPDEEAPSSRRRGRFARLRARLQNWLWTPDELFAHERGWSATRSPSGWSVTIRDPRFDRRHVCEACEGSGRHRITGAECTDCAGVGVVTDPDRGE